MSCSQRSISRLPLHIFEDLVLHRNDNPYEPSELRASICRKFLDCGRSSRNMSKQGGDSSFSSDGITTVGQVMRLTIPALLRALDPILTYDECNEFILRLCKVCTPKPSTAKELLQRYRNQFIPSDVEDLDKCLRGGFRVGSVTEVVGRAGVGKTQLVMQLCVVAARLGFGSIFIDTERKLSLQRLNEIARERARRSDPNIAGAGNVGTGFDYDAFKCDEEQRNESGLKYRHPNVVMKNVTVHSPASTDELLSVVSKLDEEILLRNEAAAEIDSEYPVKLIILDSIAAPTRRDFGGDTAPKRVAAIFQIAQWLKRVGDQMQVAVVVINQIDKVQGSASDQSYDTDFVSVTAALGTSWHHCVSTRVALEHEKDPHRDDVLRSESLNRGRVRTATVVKSNLVEKSTISFEVSVTGIRQVYE